MALTGDAAKALSAFKSGKDVMTEVYGDGPQDDHGVVVSEDIHALDTHSTFNDFINADDPDQRDPSLNQDSTELEASESADSDALADNEEISSDEDSTESSSDDSFEMLSITDEKGRREVKVDYNDRDKLKKFVRMAYGARKWQAERDKAREELESIQDKHSELSSNWSALEEAYEGQGIPGLVNLLSEEEGAYSKFVKSIEDRYERRREATPEELEAMDAREEKAQLKRELELERKAREKFEQSVKQDRDATEVASLKATVNPIFDKYRFAGKLGDQVAEHKFDKALYNDIIDALVPYEEAGKPITRALVERIARNEAQATRKYIKAQTEKGVKSAVKQRKQEATANAQTKAMKGMKNGNVRQEAVDLLTSPGGLTKVLQGWGKYSGAFGKK